MYLCELRAKAVSGKFVTFTVKDVPVRLYDNYFILANRPNSPVLITDTTCRMMDHLPLGEGDIVEIKGKEYRVSFYKGFSFEREDRFSVPSHMMQSPYTVRSVGTAGATRIVFKYKDVVFPLQSFLGVYEGKAVIAACRELADPADIQVSAGFCYNKHTIFFGDNLCMGEVSMWRGRPCMLRGDHHFEIPTGKILWKEGSTWNP